MSDNTIKDRIKQTAHDLVMQYSIRSVSMDDIASAMGISKKTIYQYFADKDELVDAVVSEVIKKNEADCDRDKKMAQNAIHEVFLAMEMMVEMFKTMNPSIIYDMQKYHAYTFLSFQKHKNEYIYNIMRQNLLRGIREELYRPGINVDILAKFRVESMMLPFSPEFRGSLKTSLLDIEEELILHFLFGLVTIKGYKLILKYQRERAKKLLNNENKKSK
jgi:AcrR family transcriptional regulator